MAKRRFAVLFTVLGVAVFLSMAGFVLLYLAFGRAPNVPSDATLVLRVGGDLSELAAADVVGYLRGVRTPTVRALVESLRKAKVDSRIHAVLIKPTGFTSPYWGKVQEVRDAMLDFKKSGKPLYAYLEYGGDREYYLSTAADKVYLMPSTSLDLIGVATYQLFLKGTLDKIGAVPDFHRIGDYKTAVNTFTEKGWHAAQRRVDEALNRSVQSDRAASPRGARRPSDIRRSSIGPPFRKRSAPAVDVQYEDQVNATRSRDRGRSIAMTTCASAATAGLNRGRRSFTQRRSPAARAVTTRSTARGSA